MSDYNLGVTAGVLACVIIFALVIKFEKYDCEKDLPRSQSCEWVAVPEALPEKP